MTQLHNDDIIHDAVVYLVENELGITGYNIVEYLTTVKNLDIIISQVGDAKVSE